MSKLQKDKEIISSTLKSVDKASPLSARVICVAVALGALCLLPAYAAPQDPAPAESASAAPAAPTQPTEEERRAALDKVGVNSPADIPNPTEDPAGAAALATKVEDALANPDPPTPKPSVAVKLVDFDPKKSYSRLLYPSVATRVGLSEEQNKRIGELMTERAQKLANAPKEEWNAITSESEKALEAVLTLEQNERFKRGITEKTIVLRFSKEKWVDVLSWFASEVGLQLVMNAPPQGTFTYSDKTAYAPKDALDILNGYLNFKGYTLIRYNDLLILHDFKLGALPLQYLPKIEPEDLPNQSRFDYVALTIPLERRNMNAVRQTIQPFMGPYCVLRSLAGNSLMVVDSVNSLREIYQAALSVYNPDPRPEDVQRDQRRDRQGPPPETPQWRAYELGGIAYTTIQEQVEIFAPSAKPLYNPQSDTLHYLAVPSVLNVVDGLIAKLKEGVDPAKNAIVKTYSLDSLTSASGVELWAMARRMGPNAGGGAFRQFGQGANQEFFTQLVDALQKGSPDAQIELNETARKLFVVASAADHEKIAATISSLTAPTEESETPTFKIYRFSSSSSSSRSYSPGMIDPTIAIVLRVTAPLAQTFPTSDGGIMVIGTQAEQDAVAKALKDYETNVDTPDQQFEFKAYALTTRQVSRFTQIYAQISSTPEMRGAVRIPDPYIPTRFAIWGKPAQQAQVARIVEQIAAAEDYVKDEVVPQGLPEPQEPAPVPAEPAPTPAEPAPAPAEPQKPVATPSAEPVVPAEQTFSLNESQVGAEQEALNAGNKNAFTIGDHGVYMTVIPIKRVSISTANSILTNMIPGLDVTIDYASPSLVVYGSKSAVDSAVQLAARLEGQLDYVLEIVDLTKELPTEVVSALPRIEPRVVSTYDRANQRIILSGNPSDVARMKVYIAQIQNSTTDEKDGVFYLDVERDVPNQIQDYVKRAVPGSEISYDGSNRRFTIIGTPTEQLAAAKLLTDAVQNLPPENETRYYKFADQVSDRVIDLIKERVKNLQTIERDKLNSGVLRVVAKPFQHEEVAKIVEELKTDYPFEDQNTFVSYQTTKEVRARFDQVRDDFTREHGSIKILQDNSTNSFAVWALPAQHEALKKLLDQLGSVESGEKETATLYTPKHIDAATLVSILKDLQPNLTIVNDAINDRLILRGVASELKEAQTTLETLDVLEKDGVERFFKSYPIKGFYSYDGVGSYYSPSYYVRDISKLAPAARITYDYYNQALVVWGTAEEHEIVEKAVQNLADNNAIEKRVLRWQIRRNNYSTLTSQIAAVYPGATPVYDSASNSLIIRTSNLVNLEAVRELLELLDPEEASEFDAVLEYYDAGASPSSDLVEAVKALVPNASLVQTDAKNKQLLVIAKPAEQKIVADNIGRLAKTYGSSDLRLIPYPVYGMKVAELVSSMESAYPSASFEADTRGSRILARATLEDHVKISEEIARVNSDSGEIANPDDPEELQYAPGPRVVVYELDEPTAAMQIRGVVANLFPEAEVFGGQNYYRTVGQRERVTVLANAREQKMIKSIVETFNKKDEEDELKFAVYPFGEADASTVDVLIGNVVPDAMSIPSSPSGARNDPQTRYQQRQMINQMRQQRRYGGYGGGTNPNASIPFYRLDETNKIVALFAKEEAHQQIRDAIEKLASLSTEEVKSVTKVYRLATPLAYYVSNAMRTSFPTVTPMAPTNFELIVIGPQAEMEKVDEFLSSIIDGGDFDKGSTRMRLFTLPEEAGYGRDRMVNIINANFSAYGTYAYPGAIGNQVIVWGVDESLDRVGKFIDEIVKTPNDETFVTYPIVNVDLTLATTFFAKICPNLEITPDATRKALIVRGTPLQHAALKKALEAFDKPAEEGNKLCVATYTWDDSYSYWPVYAELRARFIPIGATVVPASDVYEFVITATEADQKTIAKYLEMRRKDQAERSYQLRSYYLQRVNFTKVVQICPTLIPRAAVYPGKGANEIFVVATPLDHAKFEAMLSQLETTPEGKDADGLQAKIFPTYAASVAINILQPQLPGVVMYPLTNERILVWGSESDFAYVEKALKVVGEAFPQPVLKKYPLLHLRLQDVLGTCAYKFAGQGSFFSSTSGDLMCLASEEIQDEVAKMLQEFDVEPSDDSRYVPEAYDISDIPVASHPYVASTIAQIEPEALQFPTTTPGYMVIYARPAHHKKIREVVDALLKERPDLKQRMVAYTVRRLTLPQLSALLLPLYPNIKIGAGTSENQIIILAKESEHEKIAELVSQLNKERDDGQTARVYRLKNSQLSVARQAIMTMYPLATVVIDQMSRSVLVKAYEDEHAKIAQLVEEIDEKDPERNTSFKVFNIGTLNFSRLVAALRNFYSGDPAFQVQLDSSSQCLIVRGTSIQHKAVEDLIEEVRAGGLADPDAYMQTYTLKNQSALTSLYSIFYEQGRDINMYRDYSTGKLVVIGRPEEHKMVQDVLDVVAPEETELAVFDLVYVDPSTARQVFGMIETDGTYVDARFDANSNQLFVRATPSKLEEIRKVLIQMGEKDLEKMKPFVETTEKGAAETDGKRIYLRDNLVGATDRPFKQETTPIDVTKLEPVKSSDSQENAPVDVTAPKQENATPTLKIEETSNSMRTVTISGGDVVGIVDKAVKKWERHNPITVLQGDGGLIQEKNPTTEEPKAEVSATPAPAVEEPKAEAPATPASAAEEPKAEAPATPASAAEEPKAEAPATPAPAAEEPKAEAPATPASAAEEPKAEKSTPETSAKEVSFNVSPLFFSLNRSLLRRVAFGALFLDDEEVDAQDVENATIQTTDEVATKESAPSEKMIEGAVPVAPGVYVVVNPDGSLLISSSDEAALEEFQRNLSAVVDEMKDASSDDATSNESLVEENKELTEESENDPANPNSLNYLSYMTEENLAKAKERVLLESRNYTVFKVENVGVSQLVPRLQTYLADRISRNTRNAYGDYYSSSGIYLQTIGASNALSFQPDVALNTLMVYGSKADRDAVGAMIVLLDDVDLFPQPITKPYKIKVENTSTLRMAQQVLSAFSRKFQTTLLPGNLSPRISPNPTTSCIEVYAPEALAKEIEEYVKEVDKEILEESVRKVRVVELKSINSKVLTSYLTNLRSNQTANTMLSTPYIGGTQPFIPQQFGNMGMNPMYNAGNRARYQMMQGMGGMYGPGGMYGQGRNRGF